MKYTIIFACLLSITHALADETDTSLPRTFQSLGDNPREHEAHWTAEIQGLAHDEGAWYFTQINKAWRIPLGTSLNTGDLNRAPGVIGIDIPARLRERGYNHMGDLDYHNGALYIPLEGPLPHLLMKLDAKTLRFISVAPLVGMANAPWVAVDPRDGRIYISDFGIGVQGEVKIYREDWSDGFMSLRREGGLKLKNNKGTPIALSRVQGGVFHSGLGQLLLVSDVVGGGIYAFDQDSGELSGHISISYKPGGRHGEELEGIDVFEQGPLGDVHMIMLDNDLTEDDLYLKHFRLN